MDAGTLLVLAKLGAFALIVHAWLASRRAAEESRAERARKAEEAAAAEAEAAAMPEPQREAA